MVRDITLGQFLPGKSVVHFIDPRLKIVLLFAFMVLVFFTNNYVALVAMTSIVLLFVCLTKISFKVYVKSLKMIIFVVIFTSLINLFYGQGQPIVEFWFFKITYAGINNAIFIIIRIVSLIFLSSILTFTTSPTDLTFALECLMKPLKVFKISVHEIAMMMTIALRFIPTLLEETDKIMNAQKARGADMESGNLFQRIKALVPVLIPLFVSAFRRAYDLATAMECRCYIGDHNRTRMKTLTLSKKDLYVTITSVGLIVGVILCNVLIPAVAK